MGKNIRCGSIFAALALSLLAVQATSAQQAQPRVQERQVQPAQPGQPRVTQQVRPGAAGQQQAGHGTHVMAHWLLVDNQGEIALAKFVQEKSQNDEVKEFAKMMIQDHSDFIDSLQDVAGALNAPQGERPQPGQQGEAERRQLPGQAPQDRAQPEQQAQAGQPAQPAQPGQRGQVQPRNAQPAGMGFDMVRIKYELGQQCLASAKEALGEKEGAEFDKCYMGHQVFAHMQMLDTLKVFKRHATGDFAELIENGIATTEDHLMHAEKICKQLEGGAAASTARRPGTQRD